MPATMEMTASAIPAAAPRSDKAQGRSAETNGAAGNRSRSGFSSVLRSVQRTDGASAHRPESRVSEPERGSKADRREPELQDANGPSSDDARVGRRAVESDSDPGHQSEHIDAESSAEEKAGSPTAFNGIEMRPPVVREERSAPEEAANPGASVVMFSLDDAGVEDGLDTVIWGDREMAVEGETIHRPPGSSVSTPDAMPPTLEGRSDQRRVEVAALSTQEQDSPSGEVGAAGQPHTADRRSSVSLDEAPSEVRTGEEQQHAPRLSAQGGEILASERPELRIRSTGSADSSPTLENGGELSDEILDRQALQMRELTRHDAGKAGDGGIRQIGLLNESDAWEAEVSAWATADSSATTGRVSEERLSEPHADHRMETVMRQAQDPTIPSAGGQEDGAQRSEAMAAIAQSTRSAGSESDRRADAASAPSQPSGHARSLETPAPVLSRSVVFEIAQPDLGRVNVRVAVMNDLVHAHLSSDRLDVGQYLLSSQDRLQAALQAGGLEMGQFRVDIDRQGAGRSFQQGQSQDQDRMWRPERTGSEHDHGGSEPRGHRGPAYAGRLNVVA